MRGPRWSWDDPTQPAPTPAPKLRPAASPFPLTKRAVPASRVRVDGVAFRHTGSRGLVSKLETSLNCRNAHGRGSSWAE